MGKWIFYTSESGSLVQIHNHLDITDDEYMSNYKPEIITYIIVEEPNLPNTEFMRAWEIVDGVLSVNMNKARNIHMSHIRQYRNEELKKHDFEHFKAFDTEDTIKLNQIKIDRQMLRDIPQTFDLSVATTPDELLALWPAQLPPKQ